MLTTASLKDGQRSHSLGTHAFLDSTMIHDPVQHSTCFPTTTWRPRTTFPRSWRRELLQEDGDSETCKRTFQRGWRSTCTAGLRTDKEMGNYWSWVWLLAWWGEREVLGLMGEHSSKQECSQLHQRLNPIIKNLFPSTQIVGSCNKAPWAQALVGLVTK